MRAGGRATAGVLLALASCTAEPMKEDRAVRGSLATRLIGRATSGEHDVDLREVVTIEAGDAKKDAVTGFLLAEALADLDGVQGPGPFFTLADTYDSPVTAHVYHAFADVHTWSALPIFRVGRQMIVETPETVYFDGLRAETGDLGKLRVKFGAYGGVPVKIYATSKTAGGSMLGTFAESRPWTGGRVRADYMHVSDEGAFGPREDDLLGLKASQFFRSGLRVELDHTRFTDAPRDLRLRASYAAPDSDFFVQATWYDLLETQGDLPVPFDPFYATLFNLFPYQQISLLASKSLTRHLDLQTGLDARRVEHEEDVGTFNHDFDRLFATLGLRELLPAQLDLEVTGELWGGAGTDINTFAADLSRPFGERAKASIGTTYALFKYDLFQNQELDHVRTWYLRLDWERSERLAFDVRYEFEDSEIGAYQSLWLGMIWRF